MYYHLRRRDGLIILVDALDSRGTPNYSSLLLLWFVVIVVVDSVGYNWILCITRRPHLIEPKISPIPERRPKISLDDHRTRTPLAARIYFVSASSSGLRSNNSGFFHCLRRFIIFFSFFSFFCCHNSKSSGTIRDRSIFFFCYCSSKSSGTIRDRSSSSSSLSIANRRSSRNVPQQQSMQTLQE